LGSHGAIGIIVQVGFQFCRSDIGGFNNRRVGLTFVRFCLLSWNISDLDFKAFVDAAIGPSNYAQNRTSIPGGVEDGESADPLS
jgi:hypothetical protein